MSSAANIQKNLPAYLARFEKLEDNQSVSDIINAMKESHQENLAAYDKIASSFIGSNDRQTLKNIWRFLRSNIEYKIEPESVQTVKTPSAILATKTADCKGYALFTAGVLDALNRRGFSFPFVYRFVSDKLHDQEPGHVFIVVYPGTSKEISLDAIPQVVDFGAPVTYYYYIDKKINSKKMPLYKVSGISGKVGFDPMIITAIASSLPSVANLFQGFTRKGSPNDWKGWDAQDQAAGQWVGSSARGWVLNDGSDPANEANNVLQYIQANGLEKLMNTGKKQTIDGKGWRDVTFSEITNKLAKGGYQNEVESLQNSLQSLVKAGTIPANAVTERPGAQRAGLNMWLTIGLLGGAFYFLTKKSR